MIKHQKIKEYEKIPKSSQIFPIILIRCNTYRAELSMHILECFISVRRRHLAEGPVIQHDWNAILKDPYKTSDLRIFQSNAQLIMDIENSVYKPIDSDAECFIFEKVS